AGQSLIWERAPTIASGPFLFALFRPRNVVGVSHRASYRLRDEGEAVVAEAERASGLCLFMQGTQARPILLDIEVRYLPRDDPQIHDDGADIAELGPAGALRPPSDGET